MRSWTITALSTAIVLWMIPGSAGAQGRQGSGTPWSAYGFGDLVGSTQVSQALMGGVGVAVADPFSVNRVNPASYAGLSRTSFETGLVVRSSNFDTGAQQQEGDRTDLLGLSIGVPFGNGRWGLALGYNPVSRVEYRLTEARTLEDGTGDVTFEYTGEGGLNRAFIGLGRTVWQRRDSLGGRGRLSIGTNVDYLFGRVDEVRKAFHPQSIGYYNTSVRSSLVLRSPMASVGIQFVDDLISEAAAKGALKRRRERLRARDKLKEEAWAAAGKDPADRKPVKLPTREGDALRFRLGVSTELPANVGAHRTDLVSTFVVGGSGVQFPVDTSIFVDGARGHVAVPPEFALGVMVQNSRWTLAAEHRRRDWEKLRIEVEGIGASQALGTAASYALGCAFRPAGNGQGSFLRGTIYRAGLRYLDDYVIVDGAQLRQIGMSFGLSLPIMGSSTRSRFNIGAEIGERGPKGLDFPRERFTQVFMGITITPDLREQWFKKRRIE